MISVCIKKWIASESSPFTSAPITPKLVTLIFSNGLALLLVLRNGYKNKGIWAIQFYIPFKKWFLVSGCKARH